MSTTTTTAAAAAFTSASLAAASKVHTAGFYTPDQVTSRRGLFPAAAPISLIELLIWWYCSCEAFTLNTESSGVILIYMYM